MRELPRRQTIRLIVHVPVGDRDGLAAWSLMSVIEGGPVPHGEHWLAGYIPMHGPRVDEARALIALDAIVSQHMLY